MNAAMIVLTRRQAIKIAAIAGTTVVAAAVLPVLPATASALAAAPSSATALSDLPTLYGTPTDLATTSAQTAWAREPDGTVLMFDRRSDFWVPRPDHLWADLIAQGTAFLAGWAGPNSHQLVMVLFDPPIDPPVTPPSTPPLTPPEQPTSPTQPTSSGPTTSSSPGQPARPRPSHKPQLANTGAPLLSLGAGAAVAVAAGALLALRNRKSLHPHSDGKAAALQSIEKEL